MTKKTIELDDLSIDAMARANFQYEIKSKEEDFATWKEEQAWLQVETFIKNRVRQGIEQMKTAELKAVVDTEVDKTLIKLTAVK